MSTTYDHQPLLTLFSDASFAGSHKHGYGRGGTARGADDNSFLADFNDMTSSFIIHNGVWEFCADANFEPLVSSSRIGTISRGMA